MLFGVYLILCAIVSAAVGKLTQVKFKKAKDLLPQVFWLAATLACVSSFLSCLMLGLGVLL